MGEIAEAQKRTIDEDGFPKLSGVHFVTVDGTNYMMEDFPG